MKTAIVTLVALLFWMLAGCDDDARPGPNGAGGSAGLSSMGGGPAAGEAGAAALSGAGGAEPQSPGGAGGSAQSGAGGLGGAFGEAAAGVAGSEQQPSSGGAGGAGGAGATVVVVDGLPTTGLVLEVSGAGGAGGARYELDTPDRPGLVFVTAETTGRIVTAGVEVLAWVADVASPAWVATEPRQHLAIELDSDVSPIVTFYAVEDLEPDTLKQPAAAITDGAKLFGGLRDGAPDETAFTDFYRVQVSETGLRARLTPPANVRGGLQLFRADGTKVSNAVAFAGNPGVEISLIARSSISNPLPAGDYVLQVYGFGDLPPFAGIGPIPVNAVQPYTLTTE